MGSSTGASASASCVPCLFPVGAVASTVTLSLWPELADWPSLANKAAQEVRRLDPDRRRVERHGPLDLPVVLRPHVSGTEGFVVVHPFWRLDEVSLASGPLAETIKKVPADTVWFLNSFDMARRPVKALENARNRLPIWPKTCEVSSRQLGESALENTEDTLTSGNVALSDLWCCRVWGRKRSAIGSPHVPSQLIGLNGAGLSAALLGDTTPWVVLYFTPPAASRGSTRGPAVPVRTWHATQCPIDVSASTCSCIEQDGWRKWQRVWKRQPLGG